MSVEHWSDEIVLVNLPREPEMSDELAYVTQLVCDGHICDVVVDCSEVDGITSRCRSRLASAAKEEGSSLVRKHWRPAVCGIRPVGNPGHSPRIMPAPDIRAAPRGGMTASHKSTAPHADCWHRPWS